jgi:diacylglycerol kinase (ATP)
MNIRIDDKNISGRIFLVAIGNGKSAGGGFLLTPDARINDEVFDVCLVNDLSIFRVLQVLPTVLKGKHTKYPEVTMMKAREIEIKSRLRSCPSRRRRNNRDEFKMDKNFNYPKSR